MAGWQHVSRAARAELRRRRPCRAVAAEAEAAGRTWLAAERAARRAAAALEGKQGGSSVAAADSKEGRAQRRGLARLGVLSGAILAPQAMARRLREEADRLRRGVPSGMRESLLAELRQAAEASKAVSRQGLPAACPAEQHMRHRRCEADVTR